MADVQQVLSEKFMSCLLFMFRSRVTEYSVRRRLRQSLHNIYVNSNTEVYLQLNLAGLE